MFCTWVCHYSWKYLCIFLLYFATSGSVVIWSWVTQFSWNWTSYENLHKLVSKWWAFSKSNNYDNGIERFSRFIFHLVYSSNALNAFWRSISEWRFIKSWSFIKKRLAPIYLRWWMHLPGGNSTSRLRRTSRSRNESMSPICDGRWVISLQLTSYNN